MKENVVALKHYESSPDSLKELLDFCGGFDSLRSSQHVLIKPNLMALDDTYPMPFYGVYTTTRLVQDMVILLKEHGVERITIGEGSAYGKHFGVETGKIFETLGYPTLAERYGVTLLDLLKGPFQEVDFGEFTLEVSKPALEADFLINMPTYKTHNQCILSLGLKNLKGCLSVKARTFCHSPDHDLDHYVSLLVEKLKPDLTVLDGIYGLEKGPFYTGNAVRVNALAASKDPFAVDLIGTFLAGMDPSEVPHIREHAERNGRPLGLDEYDLRGTPLEELKRRLKWDYRWRDDNTGPIVWNKMGIKGIKLPKYDKTLCTGCSGLYSPVLAYTMTAFKGEPFNEIEILTGKSMKPTGEAKQTILMGNCMIKENRKDPKIKELTMVSGCPPSLQSVREAMEKAGIEVNRSAYEKLRMSMVEKYRGRKGFEDGFYSAAAKKLSHKALSHQDYT